MAPIPLTPEALEIMVAQICYNFRGVQQKDGYELTHNVTTVRDDRSLNHSNGRIIVINGDTFYTPNSRSTPNLPPPVEETQSLKINAADSDPSILQQPLWWSEETAHLAFYCTNPAFIGKEFQDWFYLPAYLPRIYRRLFGMDGARKIGLHTLEFKLRVMVESLKFKYSIPPSQKIIETALTCKHLYRRPDDFRHAFSRDISWFGILLADLSLCIAIALSSDCQLSTEQAIPVYENLETSYFKPFWLEFLKGIHFPWTEGDLWAACNTAGRFGPDIHRVGVFLNVVSPPKHQYSVDWLMKLSVPVYYPWGRAEHNAAVTNPELQRLAPPVALIQEANSRTIPLPMPNLGTSKETANPPWVAFFQDRQERVNSAILQETAVQREGRLQREAHPPTVNTKVFVWNDDGHGSYVRERVSRKYNEDTLEDYNVNQKVYNSYFNEWDCAFEFADDTIDDDDFNMYMDPSSVNSPPESEVHAPWMEEGKSTIDIDLSSTQELRPNFASVFDDCDMRADDMVFLFNSFFGFHPPLEHRHKEVTLGDKQITDLRNFVGLTKEQCIDVANDPIVHDLYEFATAVLKHQTKHSDFINPPDTWDLVPGHRHYLGLAAPFLTIRHVSGPTEAEWIHCDFGSHQTVPWKIIVPSLMTALFVWRLASQKLTDYEVCRKLLEYGTPFFTVVETSIVSTMLQTAIQVPILAMDYQFTANDYSEYLAIRSNLLKDVRRCRAALMKGGIIWRLCQSLADEHQVLIGPTQGIQHGKGTYFDNGHLVDDYLADDELDAISGIYRCETGKGKQQVMKSWWPPYSIWKQYYDYELWTGIMEAKFQQRLKLLDSGQAKPLTKQQWKEWVRGGRINRNARIGIENASSTFVLAARRM